MILAGLRPESHRGVYSIFASQTELISAPVVGGVAANELVSIDVSISDDGRVTYGGERVMESGTRLLTVPVLFDPALPDYRLVPEKLRGSRRARMSIPLVLSPSRRSACRRMVLGCQEVGA